jgi:hypothetical protein
VVHVGVTYWFSWLKGLAAGLRPTLAPGLTKKNRSRAEEGEVTEMPRLTFAILATLTVGAACLMAQSGTHLTVNVPFNFMAGEKSMPAGEYSVWTGPSNTVWLRNEDSKTSLVMLSHPAIARIAPGKGALVFTRYGEDHYFLSRVFASGDAGQELSKSRAEREQVNAQLIAGRPRPPASVVTLQATR